jgi:hypothetical protein
MDELLNWYLAPWRKIGRGPFNIILLAVSIPGFLFSVMGWGSGVGGLAGMFGSLMDMGQQFQHADGSLTSSMNTLLGMTSPAPAVPAASSVNWGGIGNWVNNLLFLACIPIARMRLRDLGYANSGVGQWVWLVLLFAGTVVDILYSVGVPGLGSLDTWTSVTAFVGLAVLCAKSAPPKERDEDHFIYTPPPGDGPHGPAKGTGEPKQW